MRIIHLTTKFHLFNFSEILIYFKHTLHWNTHLGMKPLRKNSRLDLGDLFEKALKQFCKTSYSPIMTSRNCRGTTKLPLCSNQLITTSAVIVKINLVLNVLFAFCTHLFQELVISVILFLAKWLLTIISWNTNYLPFIITHLNLEMRYLHMMSPLYVQLRAIMFSNFTYFPGL